MEAKIAKWKQEKVEEFAKLFDEYPIIGIVNMKNLPASQLHKMRKKLNEIAVLKMTKKRFLKLAINKVKDRKKGFDKLIEKLKGMPAIIFTKENPFKLYGVINKAKTKASAKPGQISPNDITIPAGPTEFTAGPIIGELGQLRIKTKIENGKVTIIKDVTIIKEGEVIDKKMASLLTKFNIEPIEIGMDLVAVYEGGFIFGKDVLAVDEKEFIQKIETAAAESFNLSVEIVYLTKDNGNSIIGKAVNEAKSISIETKFLTKDTTEDILAIVERETSSLKNELNL